MDIQIKKSVLDFEPNQTKNVCPTFSPKLKIIPEFNFQLKMSTTTFEFEAGKGEEKNLR